MRFWAILTVLFAASMSSAWADGKSSDTATFSLPGIEYKFSFPDGYCLATGIYDTQAKIAASADHDNLTDISFYVCDDMASNVAPSSWGMIKTPLGGINAGGTTRQQIIGYYKSQINPADLKKLMDDSAKGATEGIHNVAPDVDVTLDIKPVDSDENGGYMGGTITATGPGGKKLIAGAAASTVVKDRVFLLYLFKPYTGPADITDLLAKVKDATAKFVALNGG